jgi:hypothetical protein
MHCTIARRRATGAGDDALCDNWRRIVGVNRNL